MFDQSGLSQYNNNNIMMIILMTIIEFNKDSNEVLMQESKFFILNEQYSVHIRCESQE